MNQTDHDRRRMTLQAYRDAAQALATGSLAGRLCVADRANLWVIEDGAFVEATIWIPRSALPAVSATDEAISAVVAVPCEKRGA
jgi:hypothetical protein